MPIGWMKLLPEPQRLKVEELMKQGLVCPWRYAEVVTLWHRCPHQSGPQGEPMRDFSRGRVDVLADGTVHERELHERD
jgi:hypothetical protein